LILVDFSQTTIAAIMVEMGGRNDITVEPDLVRHMVLGSLRMYKQKFGSEYGEIIIACDNRNNWRKDVYQFYKANRKKSRDESTIDWDSIFKCIATVREEINLYMPYKVIQVDNTEADDVIAVLAKWSQENDLTETMFGSEPKPFLILSRDRDFVQLHKYSNVRQYSPIEKKWVKPEVSAEMDLMIKLIKGDAGDGVPSVLCPDDFLVNKEQYSRAPPVTQKVIEKFSLRSNLNEDELIRLNRNASVIDFSLIPDEIQQRIINTYTNTPSKDKSKMLNYFIKYKLKNMMETITDF